MWEAVQEWFYGLGARYGVNPVIFGAIYVGAIPFFTLSVAWIVRNLRRGKPIALPAAAACLCAVSAYLYLFLVGMNIPLWVYLVVGGLLAYGVYSTAQKIRQKTAGAEPPAAEPSSTPHEPPPSA